MVGDHNFLDGHPPDFYRVRLLEPIRKLQSNTGGYQHAHSSQAEALLRAGLHGPVQRARTSWLDGWSSATKGTCQTICRQLLLLM